MRLDQRKQERRITGHSRFIVAFDDRRKIADRRLSATKAEAGFLDISLRVCLTGVVVSVILLVSEIIKP